MRPSISLDTLDPGYWDVKKLRRKPKQWEVRSGWIHTQRTSSSRNRVGVKPEKMRDWRALERRSAEIHSMWRAASAAFWDMSRTFPRPSAKRKNAWYEVMVAVEDGGGKVLKFSEGGYSIDWSDHLLEELTKDPDCYGDFTFVPYDGGGRELARLEHRMDRLLRVYGVYRSAFQKAVLDRLTKLRDTQRIPHTRFTCHEPVTFVLTNEGRSYAVSSGTNGGFTWHEGDVLDVA